MRNQKMKVSKEGVVLLFHNEYKEKENQPDKRALGNFEGKQVEISLWKNKDPNKKYEYSGNIKLREDKYVRSELTEDDLPF